jgi:hypothetical protein
MQNDTSMRAPTEAEMRAQDMFERIAAQAMDRLGWSQETVGLSMLAACQRILMDIYEPDKLAFVLGRLAHEHELRSGVDRAESGDDRPPSQH